MVRTNYYEAELIPELFASATVNEAGSNIHIAPSFPDFSAPAYQQNRISDYTDEHMRSFLSVSSNPFFLRNKSAADNRTINFSKYDKQSINTFCSCIYGG